MKLSCAIFYSFVTTAVGATDTGSSQDQDAIVRPKLRALNATQGDLLRHEDAHRKLFDSLPESQIHALLSDDVSTKRSNLRAAGTEEEGPVTKSDEDLEEPQGISMMDLESLLSNHDILPLLKDKIGEESGVDEESDTGLGGQCDSHDDCPEDHPKCWNAGNPTSQCIGYIGSGDVNYKK